MLTYSSNPQEEEENKDVISQEINENRAIVHEQTRSATSDNVDSDQRMGCVMSFV